MSVRLGLCCLNSKLRKDRIFCSRTIIRSNFTVEKAKKLALQNIAEQRPGARVGAHSDFVEIIPEYMMSIPEKFGMSVDIEVEAKMKEQAILHLYEKYPQLNKASI